jgi:hypothetical protein
MLCGGSYSENNAMSSLASEVIVVKANARTNARTHQHSSIRRACDFAQTRFSHSRLADKATYDIAGAPNAAFSITAMWETRPEERLLQALPDYEVGSCCASTFGLKGGRGPAFRL